MINMNTHETNGKNQAIAQQIILEIAKQSRGDIVRGTTRLYKTFYLAHLYYAACNPGYLSEWPVVRMPRGPGIHDVAKLLAELTKEGLLKIEESQVGPYLEQSYLATGGNLHCADLSGEALDAIRKAVEFTQDKSGAQLSDITHEYSISWREGQDGDPLNIYLDLLNDEEHARLKKEAAKVSEELTEAWG